MSLLVLLPAIALGCGTSDTPDDTTAAEPTSAAASTATTSPSSATDASSSGDAPTASSDGGEAEATTQSSTSPTTGDDPTGDASTGASADESTGGPTSGPGVLPGETGLDAFCRRYFECGGTYYADEQDCIDASLDYWGECATRRDAQDAFGACMADIACDDYQPDAYNPASTPCAEQWSDLQQSPSC